MPRVPRKEIMSGPGGESTNRDRRRESRRDAYLQRQEAARKARQQKIRNQQIRQWGIVGAGAAVLLLVLLLIIHAVTSNSTSPAPTGQTTYWQNPATGQTVDGVKCQTSEQLAYHIHAYLKVYVDGSQIQVPGGIGIPGQCIYWLHVHTNENNFIHIESPTNTNYSLKQFFDVGGETLSATDFMGKPVDSGHPLEAVVFDANGKQAQTFTGASAGSAAQNIQLTNHETIVLLYNSPNVKAAPNTDWTTVG
jgi:hypothetical protein